LQLKLKTLSMSRHRAAAARAGHQSVGGLQLIAWSVRSAFPAFDRSLPTSSALHRLDAGCAPMATHDD
jgi:hypothetical protein